MKLLLSVFFLFTFTIPLFCQDNGYRNHSEYTTDSIGNIILQTGLKYQRMSNNTSWGFKDTIGNIVIQLDKYSFLNPIDEQGMILAKKDGKEGFIDINENILIPFIYDDLGVFSKSVDLAPAVKNKKQGFINRKGETIIPFEYDYTSKVRYFYEPGIAVLLRNGKYGVINAQNKTIVPFIYSKIYFERGNEIIIAWKQEKWACFSTTGIQLSDFNNFEIVEKSPLGFLPRNSENLPILVRIEGDKKYFSELYSSTKYMNASNKEQKYMEAQGGAKFAYLDKNHNFIVPFNKYDFADVFGLGRKAIVAYKGKYGIIDEYGELVLPLEYDFVEQPFLYSNYANIFLATKQNSVTVFDENLNVIQIKGIVSYLDWDGKLYVENNENKIGLIDYDGKQSIPFVYDTLYNEHSVPRIDGFIARKDGYYGFVSSENEIIQEFKYKYIYAVNDGKLVFVDQNNKCGIFYEDGKIKVPFEYDAIYSTWYNSSYLEKELPNTENIFIVEKDGKIGTVDDKNNVIIPIIYDGLSGWVEYGPEAHFVKNHNKYGIISPKGDIIIPIEYDYLGIPQNGIIEVRKEGKYGVMFWENKEVLPCIFDVIILDIPWFVYGKEKQTPKIVVLHKDVWKYFDLEGKLLQSNVPVKEINEKYDYMLNSTEPSNDNYDLSRDMKLKGGLIIKN